MQKGKLLVEYSPELLDRLEALKNRIFTDPVQVLDPETQHHQFSSLDLHGRKLDFDKIISGSDFFWQWVSTYAAWINETRRGRKPPDALLGMANGANRLSSTMAPSIGKNVIGLTTEKVTSNTVRLDLGSRLLIQVLNLSSIITVEDAASTGGTTASVIPELRELGVRDIWSTQTWIRTPELPALVAADVPYDGAIWEPLPTFTKVECETLPEGYCHNKICLIPHGQ